MGSYFSKYFSIMENWKRIQELAHLPSGIHGDAMIFQSGYEQRMNKRIIWEIENIAVGHAYEDFKLDVKLEGYRGEHIQIIVSLIPNFSIPRELLLQCSCEFNKNKTNGWDSRRFSVKATVHGATEMKTFESPVTGVHERCKIFSTENGSLPSLVSDNGSLVLELTLKIFHEKPPAGTRRRVAFISGSAMTSDCDLKKPRFGQFLISKQFSDVKIYSSDGEEFHAHKIILCAGNDVFKTMFNAEMTESTTGTIKLDDMSAAAVRFLLSYIYDGNILSFSVNGEQVDGVFTNLQNGLNTSGRTMLTVEEVLYVASKYELRWVLAHVDRSFRRMCSEENAATLLELSKMHSLGCKDFLKNFIKCHPRILDSVLER